LATDISRSAYVASVSSSAVTEASPNKIATTADESTMTSLC
jgi:hypothetical protein